MVRNTQDYLHRCLELHGEVTRLRYGKTQRLDEVEGKVQDTLAKGDLWEVIRAIHDHDAFSADMFGPLPAQIESKLRGCAWYRQWQDLSEHKLVMGLFGVFRQIEPVSMVLRFLKPEHYGIMSSPVATILGVRPKRRPPASYSTYLKSLRQIGKERGFKRTADVEMALWALQVGVLDGVGVLSPTQAEPLKRRYQRDTALRQLATHNLTAELFARKKLDVAEALLATKVDVAGQLAGIEFELLVGKRVGVARGHGADVSLKSLINQCRDAGVHRDWHRARRIRNRAMHEPRSVTRNDVEFLIETARKV